MSPKSPDRERAIEAIALSLLRTHYEDWSGVQYLSLDESPEAPHFLLDAQKVADCIEAACQWMPHCIGCGDHEHGFDPDEHVWAAVIAAAKKAPAR